VKASPGLCRAAVLVCLGASAWIAPALAADKDLIELQRQVAVLSEQVRTMQNAVALLQSGVDQKLGAQDSLLRQALETVNRIHTESAMAAKTYGDQLNQQEQKIAAPVAALNAKIDQMLAAFSASQENIGEMNSRLGKLEQQIVDMSNTIKALQSVPTPPPQAAGGPPPGVTAQSLFQDASRDELSGKDGLALQGYTDYLKYFGDTQKAAEAQFHIGQILMRQGNTEHAIDSFDAVIGQFPKSTVAPDALYAKAQALKKEGQRAEATQALRDLVKQYPDSDAAGKAKADLTAPPRAPKK